jgi:3-oxoacyl-(acyl-carrier-protein) synthase III
VPEKILTNADLEKMVETSDEWITSRTGIKERHIAARDEFTSDMAAKAAQRAMKMAGVTAGQIDLIVVATITPDMPFPSTACLVQQKIGAKRAAAFDHGSRMLRFHLRDWKSAQQFIMSRTYDTVLVIGAEKLSSITDWTDRNTCVLFGDGAGAAILQNRENSHGLLTAVMGADGAKAGFAFDARRRQRVSGHGGFRCGETAFPAHGRQGNFQERRERDGFGGSGGDAPLRLTSQNQVRHPASGQPAASLTPSANG